MDEIAKGIWTDLATRGVIVGIFAAILVAGYFKVWRWNREVVALEKALGEANEEAEHWKKRYLEMADDARTIAAKVIRNALP